MIRVLVEGSLYGAPVRRTSAAGKPFITAKMRVVQDDETIWCSLIAFDQAATLLAPMASRSRSAAAGCSTRSVFRCSIHCAIVLLVDGARLNG